MATMLSATASASFISGALRNDVSWEKELTREFNGFPLLNAPQKTAVSRKALQKTPRSKSSQISAGLLDFFLKPKTNKVAEIASLKEELLEAIAPLQRGAKASDEQKEKVEELASKLESLNPTRKPLASPSINGKWKLLYTTSDSILGLKRPEFLRPNGPIYQCIDAESLQARNIETWPFFNQVQATLTPTSNSAVDVKFDTFKIFGLIDVKAPESARGSLDTTFLDDELRISRGNRGNLFVLSQDDATFRIPTKDIDVEVAE